MVYYISLFWIFHGIFYYYFFIINIIIIIIVIIIISRIAFALLRLFFIIIIATITINIIIRFISLNFIFEKNVPLLITLNSNTALQHFGFPRC